MFIKLVPKISDKWIADGKDNFFKITFQNTPADGFNFHDILNLDKYQMEAMPTSGETITLEVSNGVKVTYMIEAIGHSFESVTSYQYAPQTYAQTMTLYATIYEVNAGGMVYFKESN